MADDIGGYPMVEGGVTGPCRVKAGACGGKLLQRWRSEISGNAVDFFLRHSEHLAGVNFGKLCLNKAAHFFFAGLVY